MKKEKKVATREELLSLEIKVDGERWYTYTQLAEIENITVQCLYNRVKRGLIEKIGHLGCILYRPVNNDRQVQ